MADREVSFPRLRARTQRFTLGEPRSVTVSSDGSRLLFLRAAAGDDPRTGLWLLELPDGSERAVVAPPERESLTAAERSRRERVRETAQGVTSYAADDACRVVAVSLDGLLHLIDVDTTDVHPVAGTDGCFDPRPDPTGRRIAYVSGRDMWVVDRAGGPPVQLAGDVDEAVSWGRAEFIAAEELDRMRGYWWSPDGQSLLAARVDESPVQTWWIADPAHPATAPTAVRYPAAGTPNAEVSLWWLAADGASRREVVWDRARFPYLARASWSGGPPLLQLLTRDQSAAQVCQVDVATGETVVVADLRDQAWLETFAGVPRWHGGRVVWIGEQDGTPSVYADGERVTSPDLYVRGVAGADQHGLLFTASTDPTTIGAYRWTGEVVEPVTTEPGVHAVTAAGETVVIAASGLDHDGVRTTAIHAGSPPRDLTSYAVRPPINPRPRLLTLGERAVRSGLVLPTDHVPGQRLPVILDPYAGPGAQRVLATRRMWWEPQWLADQGFAVLVADGRGTPGRDAAWSRAVRHDLATAVLADQVDVLHAAAELEPDLDLDRVGIRGWSFGGYLAALAVLRRPDVFAAAVAGAPVTDWSLYDTAYTERYLGLPQEQPDAYQVSSIIDDAPSLRRPLLLIHGLSDDNVVAAHTLRLSQRLTEAGRPHEFLALTGVTHMTPQETVAENLLLLQVDFFRRSLADSIAVTAKTLN